MQTTKTIEPPLTDLGKTILRDVILCLVHDWKAWNVGTENDVNLRPLNLASAVEQVPASCPEKLGPAIAS